MRTAYVMIGLIATTLTAAAEGTTAIVIPGRADVPIIINGIDASYAVVEGDWGLARGARTQPTIYGGRPIDPYPRVGHYFPSSGALPGYGRLEVEPPPHRKLPDAAESYHRSYSAQSAPPAAPLEVPFDPPPVVTAPGSPQNLPGGPALRYRN